MNGGALTKSEDYKGTEVGSLSIQMVNSSSWKKVLLVAIATFAIIALILSGCGGSEEPTTPTETELPSPPPTQSQIETLVDGVIRDLLEDASTEQEALDEEVEAALLGADDVLPRDIGELADER